MNKKTNRIKFALYLKNWDYDSGDKKHLKKEAEPITPTEYTEKMKGAIFCPECCVNLFRNPEKKSHDRGGRKAFFAHTRKKTPECSLRVKKAEGKFYETEEQAKEAIDNEELVIIKSFLTEKPKPQKTNGPKKYDGDPIEDIRGGLADIPIARHTGETFKVPAKMVTMRGLCREFDKNYYKYFNLPGKKGALQLQDLLINIETIREVDDIPKLYFGRIDRSWNCGKTPQNIRQTMFEYTQNEDCVDFCLKTTDENSREHGIDDDSKGKVVLMFGKITESGIGLCIEHVGWGEFAVLPKKYESILY